MVIVSQIMIRLKYCLKAREYLEEKKNLKNEKVFLPILYQNLGTYIF